MTPPSKSQGGTDIAAGVECRPVRHEEIHAALRLLLASGGRPADDGQILDFLQYLVQRRLDVNGVWIAEQGGRIDWAVLPIVSPGRTMLLITPPDAPAPPAHDAAGALVRAACDHHFYRGGIHLAQVLFDPADAGARTFYAAQGFRAVAELAYLHGAARAGAALPPLPAGFEWLTYSPASHPLFADAILDSYQDSLDCPALNGVREIDDVIAGHKACGAFDPSMWLVLRERGATRGVLLLAPIVRSDAAELVYLGLAPAARGRGLGDLLMRQALNVAAAAGCRQVSLAVDAANSPALKLYFRHGLCLAGRKVAMMRSLSTDRPQVP